LIVLYSENGGALRQARLKRLWLNRHKGTRCLGACRNGPTKRLDALTLFRANAGRHDDHGVYLCDEIDL